METPLGLDSVDIAIARIELRVLRRLVGLGIVGMLFVSPVVVEQ